jgi:4-hydroxy-tetrahydrodipicolinate synthase
MTTSRPAPFGTTLTAMVTPLDAAGGVDIPGAQRLATYLVDDLGHDGLVINGTTGEAPTTSDDEKKRLVASVVEAVGDRARILAGVGTYDTAHSIHLAREAAAAGADALLVVSPYYSRPPQEGLIAHFTAIADSTELPVVSYDIPKRTGVSLEPDTLCRLAEHPRIVANKDAKGDLDAAQRILARSDIAWYSGDDILNLPLLSIGACGFISVVGHLVGDRLAELARAYGAGDVERARHINAGLLPVYTGCFRTQAVILIKAALNDLGLPAGPVRAPLIDASPDQLDQLRQDLAEGGLEAFAVDAA